MKRKQSILFLPLLTLLASCGGTGDSTGSTTVPPSATETPSDTTKPSEPVKTEREKIEEILSQIDNNYTINYRTYSGRYNIYRTNDYMYDEEISGGQLVLNDDTMYIYTVENGVVIPFTPNVGTRKTFEEKYPVFGVDLTNFVQEGDSFFTTNVEDLTALSILVNSQPYQKAELFMENDLLNFRFYTNNKVALNGKLYNLNNTHVELLDNYISQVTFPEKINNENKELFSVLSSLDCNFIFEGKNVSGKSVAMLLNENYVLNFSGSKTNIQNGVGYIQLEDGLHYAELKDGALDVGFDVETSEVTIKETFSLQRHDYSKFIKVDENTFVSTDYYNVTSFANFLSLESDSMSLVKIKVDPATKSAHVTLIDSYGRTAIEGTLSSINEAKLASFDEYVDKTKVPTLPTYENAALIEATKDLGNNFTFVNTYIPESLPEPTEEFFGVMSNENGRKEFKEEHNNFPSTDYISYDDYAFRYHLNNKKAEAKPYDYISAKEYQSRFSFQSIDFHHFVPNGENSWKTTSLKYIGILSDLVGSNPYAKYHHEAVINLIDGVLHIEISSQGSLNTKGYLKDINATKVTLVDDFKTSEAKPVIPHNENTELTEINNKLQKTNFTIAYQDEPENEMFFTEEDYDYWTEDTFYNGFSNGGFITSPSSGYVYEYGYTSDTDKEDPNNLVLVNHPNATVESIATYNPFYRFDADMISTFMPFGEKELISFDFDVISVFVQALDLGGSSLLGYAGVILSVEKEQLNVSVIDTIEVTYSPEGTRTETYSRFASAAIKDIGTTTIPSFAVIPTIK